MSPTRATTDDATLLEHALFVDQAPAATFSLTTLDEPPGCIVTP